MAGIAEEFKLAFKRSNNSVVQIIWLNVIVFLIVLALRIGLVWSGHAGTYDVILKKLELPASFYTLAFQPWSVFTYFFLHQDVFHILFNMLALYWFGSLIKEYLNSKRLISIYILGGLVGAAIFILAYSAIPYFKPGMTSAYVLGASGSVFAVVIAAATLLPDYTMFMMFLGPIRIKYIALFYLIISIASSIGSNAGGNMVHLGGALIGYIYIIQLRKGRDLGQPIVAVIDFIKSLFVEEELPAFKPKKVSQKSYQTTSNGKGGGFYNDDIPDEDEVDALLDKISNTGYESLTKDEKLRLFKASQRK
jgi:membrane associated rhomboid family serine protease